MWADRTCINKALWGPPKVLGIERGPTSSTFANDCSRLTLSLHCLLVCPTCAVREVGSAGWARPSICLLTWPFLMPAWLLITLTFLPSGAAVPAGQVPARLPH